MKCKWSLFGTYHPSTQEDQYYCNNLSKALDTYCQYDKILSSDFNSEVSEVCLDSFQYIYICVFYFYMKEETRFKSVSSSSYIDLFLTKQIFSFKYSLATGLSNFQKLVLIVLKKNQRKLAAVITKTLIQISFIMNSIILYNLITVTCGKFNKVFLEILNKHSPLKD